MSLNNMNFYKKTTEKLTEKLKELKTWAQVKSPKTLQPALSYALDWLAPELLGTGFRMLEVSDFSLKALIPARQSNFDFITYYCLKTWFQLLIMRFLPLVELDYITISFFNKFRFYHFSFAEESWLHFEWVSELRI